MTKESLERANRIRVMLEQLNKQLDSLRRPTNYVSVISNESITFPMQEKPDQPQYITDVNRIWNEAIDLVIARLDQEVNDIEAEFERL